MKKSFISYSTFFLIILFTGSLSVISCKKKPDLPVLSTVPISGVTVSSAVSGGNITSDGGADVTARGVCWSTEQDPTISDASSSDGAGSGSFTSTISGLLPDTEYYIRAYATNSAGTAYGDEISFRTNPIIVATLTTSLATSITTTTAISGGNITSDGGGSITARGVCWSLTANPTISDSKTSDGSGSGSFTSNVTGLQPGTTYHVRAYAINAAGTTYGNDISFKTNSVSPTVTTTAVSGITTTTAISGGNVTSDGGSAVTSRGVCWGTSPDPVLSGSHTSNGSGLGSFTSNITGLSPNTKYYLRAYAINNVGTSYGNEITFTTSPIAVPTLTTTAVSSITATTATSGGNITTDGGASVTARGVCWSTTLNPTISNSRTTNGQGTGSFTSNITGLLPGTAYHVRAYATNSAGTAYGEDLTFTTASSVPTVTTSAVTGINQTSARSGGNVTSNGGSSVTARGVCWSTSTTPTVSGEHTTDGSGNGTFTSNITGLSPNTIYYIRAYATNSVGTAYGNQITFSTTNETGTISDTDGNTYVTVRIGTQWWMAENLKTTEYNDNTAIPNVTDDDAWKDLTTPAYCWYFNDPVTYKDICGAIYNWYAINTGKLCPAGWHVSTDNDWKTLEMYLGMSQEQADGAYWRGTVQGTMLKTITGWSNGGNGTNESGFSGNPGGYRFYEDGHFYDQGTTGSWLTATEHTTGTTVLYRNLSSNYTGVFRQDAPKSAGKAVRCVRD